MQKLAALRKACGLDIAGQRCTEVHNVDIHISLPEKTDMHIMNRSLILMYIHIILASAPVYIGPEKPISFLEVLSSIHRRMDYN